MRSMLDRFSGKPAEWNIKSNHRDAKIAEMKKTSANRDVSSGTEHRARDGGFPPIAAMQEGGE